MLLYLFSSLGEQNLFANLFRYITFRTGGAILTALFLSFLFGPPIIRRLKRWQPGGQPIRDDGPSSHIAAKRGTPTMGGMLILFALTVSALLWSDLSNAYFWIVLLVTLAFASVGFADDYRKLRSRSSKGIPARLRLLLEGAVAAVAAYLLYRLAPPELAGALALPFFKDVLLPLGPLFLLFAMLVIVGSSNAVNLTDGLDGLAIVPVMIAAASFGFIAYLAGNFVFAGYLHIHYVPGVGELAIFCGALLGAGLGFLWYNAPPALVFMGDIGALSLGAALGVISVAAKHELVLAIIGGLFVLEAVSVIAQVVSFRLTGKRVFRMAPLHHHFEQKGWAEPTIVIRFWIIATVLALLGMATLKLR